MGHSQRSLDEEGRPLADLPVQLVTKVLEHLDELGADGLALGLRVAKALEARHHGLGVVHTRHRQVKVLLERIHHALCLLQA